MDYIYSDISKEIKRINEVEELYVRMSLIHASPPINGDLTKGKLKWRGIKLCYNVNCGITSIVVRQRGIDLLSPIII